MKLSFAKVKTITRILTMSTCVSYLSGCATPAEVSNMTVNSDNKLQFTSQSPYYNQLAVSSVTGGSETNPLWTSQVSSEDFKSALENSLKAAGLLGSTDSARYHLSAEMINLNQPLIGFDMTVRATVSYLIKDKATGTKVFNETIDSSYTGTMNDSLLGVKRLRLANEGSIKNNITLFLDALKKPQ